MTQPIIELRDIRKSYQMGDTVSQVLQGVSLTIYPGEYVCIMGPSGCGKSTLLNVLGCLDQPSSGHYFLGGEDVACLNDDDLSKARCRNLGFIFQSYNLIQQLTVLENIEVPLYYKGVPEQESREIAIRLASQVGLSHRLHHRPTELSGGQQQRVAMARALAIDPEVIILDEPLSNLDRRLREEMRIELKRLQRSLGVTMLFVTHDQEEALSMSDKVVVMNAGSIQQVADPRGVYERPANSFVAGFLGSANFLPAEVLHAAADSQGQVRLPGGAVVNAYAPNALTAGDQVRLIVRPEWMTLDRSSGEAGPNQLSGVVHETIYEGSSIRYGVSFDHDRDSLVFLEERSNSEVLNAGDKVRINVTDAVIARD